MKTKQASISRSGRENTRSRRVLHLVLVTTTLVGCVLTACRPPEKGRVLPSPQATVLHPATPSPQPKFFHASQALGTGGIRKIAISVGGEHLAVAGSAGISLYRIDTFERVWNAPLTKRGSEVNSVAFSPDGGTLASGSNDGAIILWDAAMGERVLTPAGHIDSVISVAFSPEGTTLASASVDGYSFIHVTLWDVATGRRLRTFGDHAEAVYSAAFSPDGTTLALGFEDGSVALWDVTTGKQLRVLVEHSDSTERPALPVIDLAFSPDGTTLASMLPKDIVLWNVVTGERLHTLEGDILLFSLAFSPDGTMLASGAGAYVILWDIMTGERLCTLEGHTEVVYSVAFSPDGTALASGSEDGIVILWDISGAAITGS